MSENKKIKNARAVEFDGVSFRSKLEVFCYKQLLNLGIEFKYEGVKFDLIPSYELNKTVAYYPIGDGKNKGDLRQVFKINKKTYKPDFIIDSIPGHYIIIECKGFENDDFPSKRKLFLNLIENSNDIPENRIYLEPHNQRHVIECVGMIRNILNLNENE